MWTLRTIGLFCEGKKIDDAMLYLNAAGRAFRTTTRPKLILLLLRAYRTYEHSP